MFLVDVDEFTVKLPNGFDLTFIPCNEEGILHFNQADFDVDKPQPQTNLKMVVTGNGTNVRHTIMDANELGLQIQEFAKKPTPTDTQ